MRAAKTRKRTVATKPRKHEKGRIGWRVFFHPIIFFFIPFFLAALACREPAKSPSQETVVWRPLGNWSGHDLMQTEAFISDSGSLKIEWQAKDRGPARGGDFTVMLHSGVSGRSLLEAVTHKGAGRDVAYVNEDPREFFLVITGTNLDWQVAVSEAVPAHTAATPGR